MIIYRLANRLDNRQLIALTAASGMAGETSLRIERQPDFFALLEQRGESKIFVAVDDDTIIGAICVSSQQVYVGGRLLPLRYIGDFKVAASHRNRGIGMELCNRVADDVISANGDLAFLNVSKGNSRPLSFFTNRPGVPDFNNIGLFNIYQFIGRRKVAVHPGMDIVATAPTLELINFLDQYYARHELGRRIEAGLLLETNIYVLRENGAIVAAICIADTMKAKQNVVTRLSWKMNLVLKCINSISKIAGISKMPVLNQPVKMIYIKYLAVNGTDRRLVRLLVNHARNLAYNAGYSFASIGLHEKDPLNGCFSGLPRLLFHSVGMLLSIKNNSGLVNKVMAGIPFEDYSLV
jgi:ribosomal protein S18 acetylase RimI-like enzyme